MRKSKNQWAVSPETIMSHHFRLAKGIPHVVDATPPYSMYNSPISVHYLPKRASSADPFRRKAMSKSQRELNDFVNGRNEDSLGLRLPLPIRSSLTDLVKPKLLENRNYQPPRRRTASKAPAENREDAKKNERTMRINQFKDAVLTELIQNGMFSDKMILNCIKTHMERLAGSVPWSDLEKAADELMEHIGINPEEKEKGRGRRRISKSRGSDKKPPLPFKLERIASPKSLESLSSASSSSSKTYSSSSGSNSSGST
ncbi:unnamed protein product [Caenorhabditis sp. 36 PRJEB53466]|nr:unnamed protein product [Caenorhabditis sp. 36 PRJEB53466]